MDCDPVAEGRKFSEEWYRFYEKVVVPPDPHWLRGIEESLTNYESILRSFEKMDLSLISPPDRGGHPQIDSIEVLNYACANLDLIKRIVIYKSISLYKAFISSINREDFDSAPFLLRGIVEQAAFGFYTARRIRSIRPGFEAKRANDPDAALAFCREMRRAVYGAKINTDSFFTRVNEGDADIKAQLETGEWDIVRKLITERSLGEKSVPREEKGASSASVSLMIDALDAELPMYDVEPPVGTVLPGAFRAIWEWLSQYCHPNFFSWQFHILEIAGVATTEPPENTRSFLRGMALNRFVTPMWGVIRGLPEFAYARLHELQTEIRQDVDALQSRT